MTCASPKIPDPIDNRGSALTPWSWKYPDELRERAVREVQTSGRPVAHVAKDLGIHKEALRGWVRQAEADKGDRPDLPTTPVRRATLKIGTTTATQTRQLRGCDRASVMATAEGGCVP
ncbi:transposase [Streptomyces sp. NPDC051639]|uniref:transposase n=1 Tax=Streptomyces sp. NPDC051639 TaxID=3155671 RepID=UPI00342EFF3E